jgi:hypothetical protein
MDAYVAKLIAYESVGNGFANDLLFAADNPDIAGNFSLDSDNLADLVPADYNVAKAYLGPLTKTQVHDALVGGFGTKGLVQWVGHGSAASLAHEIVFKLADVAALTNGNDLPLFAALTCSAGRFELPGAQSLSEALVLKVGGGAAAAYSPTGLSINDDAVELNAGLLKSLYEDGQLRIGDAVIDAQNYYQSQPNPWRFMLDIYSAMGDPATLVQ